VLILDDLTAHHTKAFFSEARDRNIYPIFLVPHSSDQCQPLDWVIFGIMKRLMSGGQFRLLPSK
jgi:hypothetical protein